MLYVSLSAVGDLPDQRMAWQRADLAQLAQACGARLVEEASGLSAHALGQRLQCLPLAHYKNVPRGAHTEVFCLSQFDRVPQLLAAAQPVLDRFGVARERPAERVAGVYLQPMVQGTSCHLEFNVFHPTAAASAVQALERELVAALVRAGGFFSRPYGAWAQAAYARDPGIVPFLHKVKAMFDPRGVLNPGQLCF